MKKHIQVLLGSEDGSRSASLELYLSDMLRPSLTAVGARRVGRTCSCPWSTSDASSWPYWKPRAILVVFASD